MFSNRAGSIFVPSRPDSVSTADVQVTGDDLIAIAVADIRDAAALAEALRDDIEALEIVPGIDSVVVQFDASQFDSETVVGQIEAIIDAGVEPLQTRDALVEIPVVYGGEAGPDLADVSASTGLSEEEIVSLHTSREYTVDLTGFTPGFAFVGGLDDRLNVPRRSEPRQQVTAGSIGIADGRTGIYALPVPGGWQLIGRTSAPLFDPARQPPNLLETGARVRFVAIENGGSDE